MTKRISLLMLFATISILASAQVSWSVRGSVSVNQSTKIFDDNDAVLGGRYGVAMEIPVKSFFSIQPAFYLALKGMEVANEYSKWYFDAGGLKQSDDVINREHRCRMTYLEVPINALFRIHIGKKNYLLLSDGPYFAYGIGGRTRYTRTVTGTTTSVTKNYYDTFAKEGMGLKRFDWGMDSEIHFELGGHYLIGSYIECGWTNLEKGEGSTGDVFAGVARRNLSLGIEVGYKF
jgi:hypothetical protein